MLPVTLASEDGENPKKVGTHQNLKAIIDVAKKLDVNDSAKATGPTIMVEDLEGMLPWTSGRT